MDHLEIMRRLRAMVDAMRAKGSRGDNVAPSHIGTRAEITLTGTPEEDQHRLWLHAPFSTAQGWSLELFGDPETMLPQADAAIATAMPDRSKPRADGS